MQAIKARVRVGAGGAIELRDPALPEGAEAEVIVLVGPTPEAEPTDEELPPLARIVGSGRGGFSSVEEIDRHLRDLRDEWD